VLVWYLQCWNLGLAICELVNYNYEDGPWGNRKMELGWNSVFGSSAVEIWFGYQDISYENGSQGNG
jgi:hypothetical protein